MSVQFQAAATTLTLPVKPPATQAGTTLSRVTPPASKPKTLDITSS